MGKLNKADIAYNAAVDALNEADRRLAQALSDRDRAWRACEALYSSNRHGLYSGKRELKLKFPSQAVAYVTY